MIDPFAEELLTATEAAKLLPGRPHSATLWRWMTRGVRGRRLESLIVSGSRRTTRNAIRKFLSAITEDADGVTLSRPTARRECEIRRAEIEMGMRSDP